jgi:hypothetical protein
MLRMVFQPVLLRTPSRCRAHAFAPVLLHVLAQLPPAASANSCCVMGLNHYFAVRALPNRATAALVGGAPCVRGNLMAGGDHTPNTHEPPRSARYPLAAQPMAAEAVAVAKHQEEAAGLSYTDRVDKLEPLARLAQFRTADMAAAVAAGDHDIANWANGDALDASPSHVDSGCPVPESACRLTPSPVCSAERAMRILRGCPTSQEQGWLEGSWRVRYRWCGAPGMLPQRLQVGCTSRRVWVLGDLS